MTRVVGDMKRLRLIPMTWAPDQPQLSSHLEAPPTTHQETAQGEKMALQQEKLDTLREYLQSIETTPVCRVKPSRPSTVCVYVCECSLSLCRTSLVEGSLLSHRVRAVCHSSR